MTGHTCVNATAVPWFIDPYDNCRSEWRKVWPRVNDVAREVALLDNLGAIRSTMLHTN